MKFFKHTNGTDVVISNVVSVTPVEKSWRFFSAYKFTFKVWTAAGLAPFEFDTETEADEARKEIIKAIQQA